MTPLGPSTPGYARGQGAVEFALVLPIVISLLFAAIDLGRYSFIRGTLDGNAQRAARLLALPSGQISDCKGLTAMMSAANGITVTTDPNSYYAAAQPTASAPPVGTGYGYISPAVAPSPSPAPSPAAKCDHGTNPNRASGTVSVRITYSFVPWTPIIGRLIGTKTIAVSAAEPTEY